MILNLLYIPLMRSKVVFQDKRAKAGVFGVSGVFTDYTKLSKTQMHSNEIKCFRLRRWGLSSASVYRCIWCIFSSGEKSGKKAFAGG